MTSDVHGVIFLSQHQSLSSSLCMPTRCRYVHCRLLFIITHFLCRLWDVSALSPVLNSRNGKGCAAVVELFCRRTFQKIADFFPSIFHFKVFKPMFFSLRRNMAWQGFAPAGTTARYQSNRCTLVEGLRSSLLRWSYFSLRHCLRTEQSLRAVMVRCVCGIYVAAACKGLVMPKVNSQGKMPLSMAFAQLDSFASED